MMMAITWAPENVSVATFPWVRVMWISHLYFQQKQRGLSGVILSEHVSLNVGMVTNFHVQLYIQSHHISNSGHLHAVNVILVNLVKYLLLYCEKKRAKGNYIDEGGFEAYYGEKSTQKEQGKRKRLLSVTEDGQLRQSQCDAGKGCVCMCMFFYKLIRSKYVYSGA